MSIDISRVNLSQDDLENFINDLDEAIEFESGKDSQEANKNFPTWTTEYKSGYVDGLKRAKEILSEYL